MPNPRSNSAKRKRNIDWVTNSYNPTPLEFFRFSFPTHRIRAFEKYQITLQIALERSRDQAVKEKLQQIQKDLNEARFQQDWEQWMQEKTALSVRHSVRQTNLGLHEEISLLAKNQRNPTDATQQNKPGDDMGEEDVEDGMSDDDQEDVEDQNENQVHIERLESTESPGRTRPYILTSGTDVASVLRSYTKDLPNSQKCDDLAYWGILDLTGESIASKALFTKEDWAEMIQSFGQEVKLSEAPISDNVSCLFDKIDETIRSGLSNPGDIEHALKDINDVDSYPIKRAILTYADNLEEVDLPMSEAAFDNLFPNMLARKLLDRKQLKVGEICCWASAQRRNQGRSVVLRAQIGQRCDFKGTLRSSIDKVEAIIGLRSSGLPEAHRKKIFTDRVDLAVSMRDILYAFFSANPNAPDDKLHQIFVLGVQSWGWTYDVYAMDCKGTNVCRLGRLNRIKMPNTIETLACLEEICTVMTDIKATLRVICDKANDAALSNARARRRKRTNENDDKDDKDDAVGGCFGNVSGTPAKKRSIEE